MQRVITHSGTAGSGTLVEKGGGGMLESAVLCRQPHTRRCTRVAMYPPYHSAPSRSQLSDEATSTSALDPPGVEPDYKKRRGSTSQGEAS